MEARQLELPIPKSRPAGSCRAHDGVVEWCLHDQSAANQPITLLVTISGLQNCDFGCDRAIRSFLASTTLGATAGLGHLTSAMIFKKGMYTIRLCCYRLSLTLKVYDENSFWCLNWMGSSRCQGCLNGSTVCNYVGTAEPGKERSNKITHIGPFSKSNQLAVRITEPASPIPTIWILGIGVRDRLTSLPEGCRSATLGAERLCAYYQITH